MLRMKESLTTQKLLQLDSVAFGILKKLEQSHVQS